VLKRRGEKKRGKKGKEKVRKKLVISPTPEDLNDNWFVLARSDPQAFAARVKEAVLDSRVAVAKHIQAQYQRLNRLEGVRDQLEGYFRNAEFLAKLSDTPMLALDIWRSLGAEVSRISLTLMNINKVMAAIQKMSEVSDDFRRRMDRMERVSLPVAQAGGKTTVAELVDSVEDKKALRDMAVQRLRELLGSE